MSLKLARGELKWAKEDEVSTASVLSLLRGTQNNHVSCFISIFSDTNNEMTAQPAMTEGGFEE